MVAARLHPVSMKVIRVGVPVVSTLCMQTAAPRLVPWNTKPLLSGKKPGSYCASTRTIAPRKRSMMEAFPPASLPPCATKRPSAELLVQ
ncbi:MAG: hypothetical protein M5U28_50910 [Sandaracinaceae bacterium]|nr:hypothetical protein [Sandaracinaceae bacterium]